MNYSFDSYTKSVDHSSNQWAASDRGWFYVEGKVHGNYLEYPAIKGYRDRCIHAVVFENDGVSHSQYRTGYFSTVDQAKAWMVEEITGQLTLV